MEHRTMARRALAGLDAELIDRMLAEGRVVEVPQGTQLLHEGGYVKELPVLLDGLVRVFIGHDDKELLLYWIQPSDSCVMSFASLLERAPSRINAVTEKPSTLLLVPEALVRQRLREHPDFAELMFRNYAERYADMLRTVEQVAFGDLPTRLLEYLRKLGEVSGEAWLDLRHAKVAQELGTAREVVTRTLKKLEREGLIEQGPNGIRVIR
jgi:CRP/FNR family transcriptional regulator